MEEEGGGSVGDAFGVEGMEEAEVVDVAGDVGEEIRYPAAALAVTGEVPGRRHDALARAALAGVGQGPGVIEGEGSVGVLGEGGLVVEGVDLADAALHEEEEDTAGSCPCADDGRGLRVGGQAGQR